MKKTFFIYCLLLLIFGSGRVFAQINSEDNLNNISYERPVEYEIGGVTVEGTQNLDKNAIVTLSGLTLGDKIMLPGEDLSKAISKLWDQGESRRFTRFPLFLQSNGTFDQASLLFSPI